MGYLLNSTYLMATMIFGMVATMCFPNIAGAAHREHRFDTDSRLSGTSLENQLWQAIQTHNAEILSELISPIYLGGSAALGFTGHSSEISNLTNLNIDNFSILNISETQGEDIRIVAYQLVANGSTPLNDRRVSVWQRTKHKHHQFFWQLISHTIL